MADDPFRHYELRRRLFLDEWHVGVHSFDEDVRNRAQGAVDIAQTALKTATMLNGGALVLIPAYLALLRSPIDDRLHGMIVGVVVAFTTGLFLSWASAIAAYFTMVLQTRERWESREAVATRVHKAFQDSFPGQHPYIVGVRAAAAQRTADEHDAEASKARRQSERLRWAGIILNLLSFGAFVTGCIIGISAVT